MSRVNGLLVDISWVFSLIVHHNPGHSTTGGLLVDQLTVEISVNLMPFVLMMEIGLTYGTEGTPGY